MIYWSSNPLEWQDFKRKAPKGSTYDAETVSAIDVQMAVSMDSVIVAVYTYFDPGRSWKKNKKLTPELLKHEQLHFDITEYHSRLLRKDLLNAVFKKPQSAGKTIQKLFNRRVKKWKKMQNTYDSETKHSTVVSEQKKWEESISTYLKETKKYTETILRFAITG